LAMELIRRNGLRPNNDIEIRFSGIRPGEKLYEELAGDDEQTRPTSHPKIRVWQLPAAWSEQVNAGLEILSSAAATGNSITAMSALARCVAEYRPSIDLPQPHASAQGETAPKLRLIRPESEAA
ncbi:MAG TPA: polysaccharide biosynthesis protein, partial [Tepidisphaeraceae bacterium]|nr:polysaccharide biosynthesis protein [Tepidisphaeraceae bacterium]